ncbi:hypothetical protein DVH24_018933 [Malus domestica]|uniref:Uncharacterized protein n=1 Tax=Malus domestica TaxID=3750 RepID=A0A498HJA3_MALDO|nr:hypothetical protein DVH24_018933 [Malus domestica]
MAPYEIGTRIFRANRSDPLSSLRSLSLSTTKNPRDLFNQQAKFMPRTNQTTSICRPIVLLLFNYDFCAGFKGVATPTPHSPPLPLKSHTTLSMLCCPCLAVNEEFGSSLDVQWVVWSVVQDVFKQNLYNRKKQKYYHKEGQTISSSMQGRLTRHVIDMGLRWVVGNGKEILLWTHCWVFSYPLFHLIPETQKQNINCNLWNCRRLQATNNKLT